MKKTRILLALALMLTLCLTACTKPSTPSITGTEWNASGDNSYFVLGEDGAFLWAQDEEVLDDNYFGGTYEFYRGEEALTYVTTELAEYAVTEDEIRDIIARNEGYVMDNFVCVALLHETFILYGEEQIGDPVMVPLYGMILEDDTVLYVVNMNTGGVYTFLKQV